MFSPISLLRSLAVVAAVGLSAATSASALTITLDRELDGGLLGNHATVTITESSGALDFVISLAGTDLGAGGDLHELYFNLVGTPTGLALSNTNAPNSAYQLLSSPSIAGGAGISFEHGVSFGNGAGGPGNGVLKTASFRLSATQPLSLASLMQLSTTSGGASFNVALHVQGTTLVPGVTSETVGGLLVPEPTTASLLVLGLASLGLAGRRARR